MAYKIQPLVESGYDFSGVFPEKQQTVRSLTGLDFNLTDIVKFLQKQTNNFSIENPIAHDLDSAIFDLVKKNDAKSEPPEEAPAPPPPVPVEKTEEEKHQELLDAIELLELIEDGLDEQGKEALEILKSLV